MYLLIFVTVLLFLLQFPYFTFHYVSINIKMQRIFFTSFDVFTFHYVSINIEIGETLKEGFRTLHSTMYLLIFA